MNGRIIRIVECRRLETIQNLVDCRGVEGVVVIRCLDA